METPLTSRWHAGLLSAAARAIAPASHTLFFVAQSQTKQKKTKTTATRKTFQKEEVLGFSVHRVDDTGIPAPETETGVSRGTGVRCVRCVCMCVAAWLGKVSIRPQHIHSLHSTNRQALPSGLPGSFSLQTARATHEALEGSRHGAYRGSEKRFCRIHTSTAGVNVCQSPNKTLR